MNLWIRFAIDSSARNPIWYIRLDQLPTLMEMLRASYNVNNTFS